MTAVRNFDIPCPMNTETLQTPADQKQEFGFGEFAKQPPYIEVNRSLLKKVVPFLPDNFWYVDVATGTGMVPKILMEEAVMCSKSGTIFGVDPNQDSLKIARRDIRLKEGIHVEFIEGRGQDLKALLKGKVLDEEVDGASIHDAIHEIPGERDKKDVLKGMAGILKPGGVFSMNSTFIAGAMNRIASLQWGTWRHFVRDLLQLERGDKKEQIEIHTPEEYMSMIRDAGLVIVRSGFTEQEVQLPKKALEAISRYPAFIEGFLKGLKSQKEYSLKQKSDALITALGLALDKLKVDFLPRFWFEVIAQKPPVSIPVS